MNFDELFYLAEIPRVERNRQARMNVGELFELMEFGVNS